MRRRLHSNRKHNRLVNQEVEQTAQAVSFARSDQPVPVLSDGNHRKVMAVFSRQRLGNCSIPAEESRKGIRVENHRHSDGSMRSRSASMNRSTSATVFGSASPNTLRQPDRSPGRGGDADARCASIASQISSRRLSPWSAAVALAFLNRSSGISMVVFTAPYYRIYGHRRTVD